jgi:hypothetical protein
LRPVENPIGNQMRLALAFFLRIKKDDGGKVTSSEGNGFSAY